MSKEKHSVFDNLTNTERAKIESDVLNTIKSSMSRKEYKNLQKRLIRGDVTLEELSKQPGVMLFDNASQYATTLDGIGKMIPTQRKNAQYILEHELDHYEEAEAREAESHVFGLVFGTKDIRKTSDGETTRTCTWSGFHSCEITGTQQELRQTKRAISLAPKNPSKGDRRNK